MNHSTLKKFAAKARVDLIEQVGARLQYVLTSDSVELREKAPQVKQLKEALKQESETVLVERVAYTWFNRLAALRFMDAEGRHPFGCRVVTATPGNTQPELLQQARSGVIPEGLKLDVQRMNDLLDGRVPSSNAQAEVYRMLVVAVCNFYHQLMPFVFEKIADYTELLLPEDLLSEASVAEGFRSAVTDPDCEEVELIGWLYQYYIAEKKDAVMARKKAVPKEDIPAVTQLFTPHWIVRYMVENSLGRLWMQSRPSSKLTEKMPYYIADVEENADAIDVSELKITTSTDALTVKSPEEIRLIDPACGSGHILTYAFDLLYAIYEEEGYEPSTIPGHILSKNLYGVEIDERAAELAYFALTMKAQQHYGRFLRRQLRAAPRDRIVPEICCLEEIHFEEGELNTYMDALDFGELFTDPVLTLMHQFEEAKSFGFLIQPVVNDVAFLREAIEGKDLGGELFLQETHRKVNMVLRQAGILSQRYHCVVANPPYMATKAMNPKLRSHVENNYSEFKSDLYACSIARSMSLSLKSGYLGFMTPFTWMSLTTYKKLREMMISTWTLTSLVKPEYNAFWASAHVPICTFTMINKSCGDYLGAFVDLSQFYGADLQPIKTREAIRGKDDCPWFYYQFISSFRRIPNAPIVFWISDQFRNCFELPPLGQLASIQEGLKTGENDKYIRRWNEVSLQDIKSNGSSDFKWVNHTKGGGYRRWYGNIEDVLFYENKGELLKKSKKSSCTGTLNYYKENISWGRITSDKSSFRLSPSETIPNMAGLALYPDNHQDFSKLLLALNAKTAELFLKVINPTLNYPPGPISLIPIPDIDGGYDDLYPSILDLARTDWDNFENSWGFEILPLLREDLKAETIIVAWQNWNNCCRDSIARMQELESENNRLWIDAYGLQDELTPEVPEKEITLARADPKKDMAAFLSYAVGCMFGRYSLDKHGLILANAGESLEDYIRKVKEESDSISFMPDDDNIIPVLDGEWFEDDIVARFREFLKATFSEETLGENIRFIEESLGKDLRKYFVTDFYKDHLQTYKKRPIYWLFQSPKKSFQALIYLHRYDRDTVNLLLNDYLREFQNKLQNRRQHLNEILASESTSARDKTAATKEQTKIDKALPELADWEREVILPLAQQRLEIDLDDGVKQNYPKFGKALAKIAGVS